MRIFGLTISRRSEKALSPPDRRDRWYSVLESFSGAWQQNVEVKLDSVLAYSTVHSCMTLIANDISKLRVNVVKESPDGVTNVQRKHPLLPLLRRPNPFQNSIQFFQHWVISKLAHGNVYILKHRDGRGNVIGLYLLDPMRVRVLVSDEGEVFYELKQDFLSGLTMASVTVPASEIIHDRMNTLHHPLVGLSPIYACGLAATQGLNMQTNSTAFFGNGARPSGVITAPGEIKKDTAERIKETWNTSYTGANSGKVAVLGDGLKYEPMVMTMVDAQMIEQLKWTAETVANCFHVPYYKVGGPPPAYNNIEALQTQYYTDCLQIQIESIEWMLTEGLAFSDETGVEFDLDGLLRMDTSTLVKAEADAVKAGIKAPNESRRRLNLPPVKGGETPYLQQQNFSLAALAERDSNDPFAKPPPPPVQPPVEEPEDEEEPEDDEEDTETERALAAIRFKFAEALHA